MVDLQKLAKKWQGKWAKQQAFEADADDERPKFFVTFPYPYVNGYPHIGHSYTCARVDTMARYQRMRGKNVLFPQGWHATGSPIDSAARRVREKEPKQIAILKSLGFSDDDLPKFEQPKHWIKVFGKVWGEDLRKMGMSIDWRRNFVTTDLNPHYSAFIQWQFRKLKDKGFVQIGKHPVTWCPKENGPVPDHNRSKGEGIAPEEMTLLKFTLKTKDGHVLILPAATFRPETVYGVTNIWLNPDVEYADAQVDGERWIVSKECLQKLQDQQHTILASRAFKGKELIGERVLNPVTGDSVLILPASFVSANFGTGVVMSVPAHAPYDYMALKEIQDNHTKYGFDASVKSIKPVSLIAVPGYKDFPAIEECRKRGIQSQQDAALEEATTEVYKKEFHQGKLKQMFGQYAGKTISEAKQGLTDEFVSAGRAAKLWELAGEVVCRCLSPCHVRIVDNQWFLTYGDQAWKQVAHKALKECKLYPEKVRTQFSTVLDWLRDWACTREFGMGTRLPWDEHWIIESLSDSTLYMAYYTIAHLLKEIPAKSVTDAVFDYAFLGRGDAKSLGIPVKTAEEMRKEFTYWYPVDFRNSGKDLVQNHLSFFLFNHAAIFPEKYWPRGIGVNGYVNVQGSKMAKSAGNFRTLRQCMEEFSPDVVRMTILSSGEELADVDWDPDAAFTLRKRIEAWYEFATKRHKAPKKDEQLSDIDLWMESQLNGIIKDSTAAMDETLYRTAILRGYFDLQRNLKWYMRRKADKPNKALLNRVIETQTLLLTPFAPHTCEEIWSKIAEDGFVSFAKWPVADLSKINPALDAQESSMESLVDDIRTVMGLAKLERPQSVTLVAADDWKHRFCKDLKHHLSGTRNIGDLMRMMMTPEFKQHGQLISQLVQRFVKDPGKLPAKDTHQEAELAFLSDAIPFLESEFGCSVKVLSEADAAAEAKAKSAMPGKPAIIVQ